MALTVAQLINKLRKYPSDALVGYKNPDQSMDEFDGYARTVDEAPEVLYQHEENYLEGRRLIIICG